MILMHFIKRHDANAFKVFIKLWNTRNIEKLQSGMILNILSNDGRSLIISYITSLSIWKKWTVNDGRQTPSLVFLFQLFQCKMCVLDLLQSENKLFDFAFAKLRLLKKHIQCKKMHLELHHYQWYGLWIFFSS